MPAGSQPQDCLGCAKLRAELAEMNDTLDKADEHTKMLMEHIEAKDKRIKAFEERLEVDPKHTVDGIQARDATIALLEKRITEKLSTG